ncbi:MAG: hypothetical protein ACOC2D_04895 [Spirochaetota bacterium]
MSVTIILAAIVGVGIWLFYPRGEAEPDQLTEADGGLEWEPLDYLRGDDELPGLESGAEEPDDDDEFVVTYGVVEDQDERDGADEGFVTETPRATRPPRRRTPTSTVPRPPTSRLPMTGRPSVRTPSRRSRSRRSRSRRPPSGPASRSRWRPPRVSERRPPVRPPNRPRPTKSSPTARTGCR